VSFVQVRFGAIYVKAFSHVGYGKLCDVSSCDL